MPVVPFHISSASAVARANGTASDLTLPLTGALQIPNTATPRAWLSSLLFPNELANATAATQTSTVSLGTGDGHVEWDNDGSARPYWLGLRWQDDPYNGNTTVREVCVPLTKDGGLPAAWQWPGIKEAGATNGLHGLAPAQVVALFSSLFPKAFNLTTWRDATAQTDAYMPLAGRLTD